MIIQNVITWTLNLKKGIKELFEKQVISFHPNYCGISIKIDKFLEMKYDALEMYKDENRNDKVRTVTKQWE